MNRNKRKTHIRQVRGVLNVNTDSATHIAVVRFSLLLEGANALSENSPHTFLLPEEYKSAGPGFART